MTIYEVTALSSGSVATWLLWIEFLLSIGLGTGAAYLLSKFDAIGFVLLGAWFGATTTVLFQNIVLRFIVSGLLVFKMWFTERKKEGIVLGSALFLVPILFTYVFVNVVLLKHLIY